MAAVRHLEFSKIAVLIMWPISACYPSFLFQISRWSANMAPRYSEKTVFNMASVCHLEFAKFRFFVKSPSWELKSTSVYQIWSKSDVSPLRYGNNAIFKMAADRHLEFSKIAVLVTWPISACDPSSPFQISRWSANMGPRYRQKKTILNMASVRHLGFVMTSSYCIQKLHFTFPTLCYIFTAFGFVVSEISCISCFSILAWNCLFRA